MTATDSAFPYLPYPTLFDESNDIWYVDSPQPR
jgi:hypothetical protein